MVDFGSFYAPCPVNFCELQSCLKTKIVEIYLLMIFLGCSHIAEPSIKKSPLLCVYLFCNFVWYCKET
ncbi:hypothetical protein Fmac_009323 [Flemingia macrophylla]|uniref:Uncharacterized protein n=1 Tax=Flemingia macrophylla TaxID=520843 RepID=A0ABD1MZX0_9FABA